VDDAALLAAGHEVEDVSREAAGEVLGADELDLGDPVDVAGVQGGDVPGVDAVDDPEGVQVGVAVEAQPAGGDGVAVAVVEGQRVVAGQAVDVDAAGQGGDQADVLPLAVDEDLEEVRP